MDGLLTDLISHHGRHISAKDTQAQPGEQTAAGRAPSPGMGAVREITLQRVLLDRPVGLRGLYWHLWPAPFTAGPGGQARADGGVSVEPGAVLSLDTYFNAFYEQNWRGHTAIGTVFLHLDLRGAATLRVTRPSPPGIAAATVAAMAVTASSSTAA
jgi:hypothetical protein